MRTNGDSDQVTPPTETFQAIVWQLPVSPPSLKAMAIKWESLR